MRRFIKKPERGAFSKLRLITDGPLSGRAWKKTNPFSKQDSKKIRILIQEYINELNKAGASVIETKVYLTGTNEQRINFLQPHIPKELILDKYLKKCDDAQAILIAKQMNNLFNKIKKHNLKNNEIGFDYNLTNFALIDGKIHLIDLFPPLIKREAKFLMKISENTLKESPLGIIQKLLGPLSHIATFTVGKQRFITEEIAKGFYRSFSRKKPNLKKEFYKIFLN